jgi:hypothetical protein
MKKLLYLIPLLFVAFIFSTCSKDEDTTELTKTEMLTGQIWVSSAKTVSPAISVSGASITDIMFLEPDCSKDNSFTFNTDGSFIISEEDSVCSPVTSVISTWQFNSNEAQILFGKVLTFNYGFMTLETNAMNINSIAKDKLVFSLDVSSTSGTNYVIKLEFKPKK